MDVTYDFYRDIFFGKLSEEDFNRGLPRALADFNAVTFNRVPADSDNRDFLMCVCDLIDFDQATGDTALGGITSMSDGATSIHMERDVSIRAQRSEITARWLAGYPELTYRGF